MNKIFILLVTLVVCVNSYLQAQNCVWAASAGGKFDDSGKSICTDAIGNIYVTGNFDSPTITFGTTSLANRYGGDIFIVKYAPNGTMLWANRAGGTSADYSAGICIDNSGNVYVTGSFDSPTITFGTTTLTNANNPSPYLGDFFIVKYDPNGTVLWATSAGGNGSDYGKSISTDTSGNLYVTGSFESSTISFGNTVLTNSDTSFNKSDIFIVKYSPKGMVLWATSAGSTNEDNGNSISTDPIGNVYVTGSFQSSTIMFVNTILTNADSVSNTSDIFIVKYNTNGNVLWATSAGGIASENGKSICADANGNVYVTGSFESSTIKFGNNILTNTDTTSSTSDVFIVKYNPNGVILWAASAGGTGSDEINSVCTDLIGNAYVTGNFRSPTIVFGNNILTNTDSSSFRADIFIVKYSSNSQVNWATSAGGNHWDIGESVCSDDNGNIYVTGSFQSSNLVFGNNISTQLQGGGFDVFIAKYNGIITGVNELFTNNELIIYPNPATNSINISMPNIKTANISINTLTGNQVANFSYQNNKTIDISNLAEGIYFVTLVSDKGTFTKKLIKTNK